MFDSKNLRRIAATTLAVPLLLVSGAGAASADSWYSAHHDAAGPEGAYSKGMVSYAGHGKAFYHKYWRVASPEGAASGSVSSGAH